MTDALATTSSSGGLAGLLGRMTPEIARALPAHVKPERMCRIALTALRATPKLHSCTPESFLGAIVQAAQLGLEVNTPLGHAYLVPYKTTCQLILGYQGMMDLARRSGELSAIYAHAVYEADTFAWSLGLSPDLTHVPARGDRGELTHAYAVARLRSGDPVFTVLTRAEVDARRARGGGARSDRSTPWATDYEAMARKTAIRSLFTWLPKSAEMAQAAAIDEAPEIGRSQLEMADETVRQLVEAPEVAATATPATLEAELLASPPADPALGPDGVAEPGADG